MAGVEHLPRFALEGILINLKRGGLAILLATSLLAGTTPSFASSHREAPGITKLPKTDSTDFYMFRSYEPGRDQYVTLIANYIPLQDPGGGPNYFTMDPDAVYEIHIDNVGDAHEHITYQFKFNNSLQNNTGVTLNVGGKTTPIALRQVGPVSQAANDPNLGEIESYTVTMISGDRHTSTRQSITNAKDGS